MPQLHTRILDVKVARVNYQSVLQEIVSLISSKKNGYICVAAVHLIMECVKDNQLRLGVNQADIVTPDGMPLVWLQKFYGNHEASRVYGPTLTLKTCELAERNGYRLFFLGGAPRQSQLLKKALLKRFPDLKMVGFQETPIRPIPEKENQKILQKIKKSRAEIIFVGLGCPLQEKWMIENYHLLNGTVCIGVGAAFDFITDKVAQAPAWIQNHGLEWLFRLTQDPRRLWHRYTVLNTQFILLITHQLLQDVGKKFGI